jgi:UDP:flavonoid glycosyltransferase YjiC (YdhE family)
VRVLFTAHGGYGHVFPIVDTARALRRDGHEVTVATAQELCPAVSSLGLRAVPVGIDDVSLVAQARRRWPEIEQRPPATWAVRMFTDIAAPAMVAGLAPVIGAWRPDLVIREEGEHGGPVAAAAAGIPWITHGWGSPLPPRSALDALASGVAPLWQAAGLAAPRATDLDGIGVLDPCPPSLYPDGAPARAQPIRPATTASAAASDIRPPTSDRPLAYVGFGTVPLYRDRPELLIAVVEALLARGFEPIVTTPDPSLTARLISLAPERVRVERWLSLPEVIESCRLVVCHGGAGTTLAALIAGIPLLLLPQGSPSQIRMSDACELRGVARVVRDRTPDGVAIDQALAELTADDRAQAAARELAAEIAAMPRPHEAITAIHTLDPA